MLFSQKNLGASTCSKTLLNVIKWYFFRSFGEIFKKLALMAFIFLLVFFFMNSTHSLFGSIDVNLNLLLCIDIGKIPVPDPTSKICTFFVLVYLFKNFFILIILCLLSDFF